MDTNYFQNNTLTVFMVKKAPPLSQSSEFRRLIGHSCICPRQTNSSVGSVIETQTFEFEKLTILDIQVDPKYFHLVRSQWTGK